MNRNEKLREQLKEKNKELPSEKKVNMAYSSMKSVKLKAKTKKKPLPAVASSVNEEILKFWAEKQEKMQVWKSEIEETKKHNQRMQQQQARQDKKKRKVDFEKYTHEKVSPPHYNKTNRSKKCGQILQTSTPSARPRASQ